MAARTFGNIDPSCLTGGQLESLSSVGITAADFIRTNCSSPSLNSCGRDFFDRNYLDQFFILTEDSRYYLITEEEIPLLLEI